MQIIVWKRVDLWPREDSVRFDAAVPHSTATANQDAVGGACPGTGENGRLSSISKTPKTWLLLDFISLVFIYVWLSASLLFVLLLFLLLLLLPRLLLLLLLAITVAIFGGARIPAIRPIRDGTSKQVVDLEDQAFLTSPSSSSSSCSLCRDSVLGCAGVCCVSEETLTSWTDAWQTDKQCLNGTKTWERLTSWRNQCLYLCEDTLDLVSSSSSGSSSLHWRPSSSEWTLMTSLITCSHQSDTDQSPLPQRAPRAGDSG